MKFNDLAFLQNRIIKRYSENKAIKDTCVFVETAFKKEKIDVLQFIKVLLIHFCLILSKQK